MPRTTIKEYVLLHALMLLYSFCALFSKFASGHRFFSTRFILNYSILLFFLLIYTFFWQKILKVIPLSLAYANKAVITIWGVVWGYLFFGEQISALNIIGALIIITGIYLVVAENA